MNDSETHIRVKRVSSRKRSRDGHSHLTPARKRGGGDVWTQPCPTRRRSSSSSSIMAQTQPTQYCSDTEDLFGDYDSILQDSSFLAKLDDAEHEERQRDLQRSAHSAGVNDQGVSPPRASNDGIHSRYVLTDSIVDGLGDEALEDLPASQMEQVSEDVKRSRKQDGVNTSTPRRDSVRTAGDAGDGQSRARRTVTDQLKRTMLCNAVAPSNISRTVVLKEAVVSEEISVALQAMETVSSETTDLGPFFGLPSKVKDLMHKLRGIKSLYGDTLSPHSLHRAAAEDHQLRSFI